MMRELQANIDMRLHIRSIPYPQYDTVSISKNTNSQSFHLIDSIWYSFIITLIVRESGID